jgi:hypothetical protein
VSLTLEAPARGIPGPVVVSVHRAPEKNSYRVALDPGDPPAVFGKLAGSTPPEVSAVLGIPSDSALAIAAQFDPPYLLAASPGDAHSTLARLTGVTTLLRASREGNRRRLAALTAARTLGASLDGIRATLGETRFLTLEARLEALADATTARARLAAHLERRAALDTARAAHARLIALRESHRAAARVLGTPAPSLDRLAALAARRDTIAAARLALVQKRSTLESIARERAEVDASLEAALAARDESMRAALVDAATCPMCGQALPLESPAH